LEHTANLPKTQIPLVGLAGVSAPQHGDYNTVLITMEWTELHQCLLHTVYIGGSGCIPEDHSSVSENSNSSWCILK